MNENDKLKELVKEKYGAIVEQSDAQNCGCGCGCGAVEFSVMAEDYTKVKGYVAEADLQLGCGLPTEYARIKPGDTVVDLGSGAGNDVFIARRETGEQGRVIGIDMTEAMIEKAMKNAAKLGFTNVEFRFGDIESIPIDDATADVVVSNCVMNLVPDKNRAFAETYRILKPGGHFSISDIVVKGSLPESLRKSAEMYAGCVAGAVLLDEYLSIIVSAGFTDVAVQKIRKIDLPADILAQHLSESETKRFGKGEDGIYSVTVFGRRPA